MDNMLIQVTGHKKVVLFSPQEACNLYLDGDKSAVLDIDNPDLIRFPKFAKACRIEGCLEPGDILFIPALWFHNVISKDFGIAVNVFWKHLQNDLYDGKDTYGNKDLIPAQRAMQIVDNAIKALENLPKEYRDFYARRLMLRIQVRVMGNKGPLKHTAFAEFQNKETALQVLAKLHQVELLGCKIVVELARDQDIHHFPSVTDTQPESRIHEKNAKDDKVNEKKDNEVEENPFDFSFHKWGLKYPRRRRLFYLYPPPSPSILMNISNALAACPKFYVQAADTIISGYTADKLETEEMELSSTEESEIEGDAGIHRPDEEVLLKRPQREKRRVRKRARLSLVQPQNFEVKPSSHAVSLEEVFEQIAESGSRRKIQLNLPNAVTDAAESQVLPLPEQPEDTAGNVIDADKEVQSSGFGVLTPVVKPLDKGNEEEKEKEWSETIFVTDSELSKGRMSHKETEKIAVFRNYQQGEPSRRLYIKNLARQVTEEDLHWIFGRYVNWADEGEKIMFDIRLMREGRMKGQAFVTLPGTEQAKQAVADVNAFVLKGKPMAVQFARSAKHQDDD
ncbi:hypothetical protein C0Q70_00754 [Pomacea canaliculata]|uniref:RNA-binding region-containing protein 3 n=1 Tax=Pomacea canaliculata TaxID=400727 RepID=A0A2T7PXI6_POMCA|nr:hypothetical protein C0Q70_00754 [Pomacea canaliculata]